jgi:hypothetical protein
VNGSQWMCERQIEARGENRILLPCIVVDPIDPDGSYWILSSFVQWH